ncbi:hypothetical protein GCM10009720_16450 [Yaniella flava]|uniref:Uncharacterized protein n=1 Tax=Yaniella flava TaxID=287930 RepID=A0ABN2UFJ5_9MICC|nr:hypothetical protein [Micrococcaceae bacterium]
MTETRTITLPIRDLHNAVKNIMHFAPKTLPKNANHLPLDGAHLVARRGTLVLEATDTAKMMQVNISADTAVTFGDDISDEIPDQSFGIIGAEDLKEIELALRDTAKIKDEPLPIAELVCTEDSITVGELNNSDDDSSITYDLITDQRFPDVDRLLTAFDFDKAPESVLNVYDPMHFKALTTVSDTRATRKNQSLSLAFDAKRKAVAVHWISQGEVWAQGLFMPLIKPMVNPGVDLFKAVQF